MLPPTRKNVKSDLIFNNVFVFLCFSAAYMRFMCLSSSESENSCQINFSVHLLWKFFQGRGYIFIFLLFPLTVRSVVCECLELLTIIIFSPVINMFSRRRDLFFSPSM